MDATAYIAAVRRNLDDTESDFRKGTFFAPEDIERALNCSQLAVAAFLARRRKHHLLERLKTSVAGSSSVPLPADYFLALDALADGVTAQLYIGGVGRNFFYQTRRASVIVEQNTVYFRRNGAASAGELLYYRQPSVMTGDAGHAAFGEPADFGATVYDVIVRHASAALSLRIEETTRFVANFKAAITTLAGEPPTMLPAPEVYS